jgi:hypothetical protein
LTDGSSSPKALLRRVPGVVASKRLALRAYHRVHPLRPPVESSSLVERMLVSPDDDAFITGNGIAERCRYVLNYDVFRVNEQIENNWWFCNPEFLEYFFRRLAPEEDYVLFTHNSNVDRPIDGSFARQLDRPELVAWLGTNAELRHPKLVPLALGVGNPIKCDPELLKRVQAQRRAKEELFEASFFVSTNPAERAYCVEQTGIEPVPKTSQAEFFERLASSYFVLSPNGNGVDCYRTWQALYLRTVPIVTRSLLTEAHPDLPLIVLDDWSDFRTIEFSTELYEATMGDWDPAELRLDRYLERIEAAIRRVATSGPSAPSSRAASGAPA